VEYLFLELVHKRNLGSGIGRAVKLVQYVV
jgi:hypothetical protein